MLLLLSGFLADILTNLFSLPGFSVGWWILCALVLFTLVGSCESSEVFQRLNYGVMFQQTDKVIIASDTWYHTFELSLPNNLSVPRLATCKKDNNSCKMLSHFLSQLDSVRAETVARLNATNQFIEQLIPQTHVHKSRSKRALLPFIGTLSKGLFNTATMDDFNVLATHMNKLNKMATNLAKALTQHEDHLSSFMETANSRMDNLMSGVTNNRLGIKLIQNELHTTALNLEQSFNYMMDLLIDQINTSNSLNHALDELKIGINSLVNGQLSPLLIPEQVMESTVNDIAALLQRKFHGFHLSIKDMKSIYSDCKYLFARNGTNIYITIKLPVSHFTEPLILYRVISSPVPINSTSTHATQLLDLPPYFLVTGNKQYYAPVTDMELTSCRGNDVKYCTSSIALTPVTSSSCILALYANDKNQVKSLCDFRFLQNVVKPKIIELSPNTLLVYRTPLLSLECIDDHRMAKGCDFCLFKLPCRCSISTNNHFFPPRLASCHHSSDNITTIHPVNLALLQHFFDDTFVNDIFADTIFSKPVNVTLPQLKIYEHEMSDIVAADSKAHLSLAKMAQTAKQDKVIFQSIAEPLLDGQIDLDNGWQISNTILLYIVSGISGISIALFVWTVFKIRKLSAGLLLVEKVQNAKALVTDVPSFIYKSKFKPNQESSTISFSFEMTWDKANCIILCVLFIFIAISFWKRCQMKRQSKLCLEVTGGKMCTLLDIIQLPMCPSYYHINVPYSINKVEVKGHWYAPKLHVSWPNFTIRNTSNDDIVHIKSSISISFWNAYKLKKILSKNYFVYVYKYHHGVMIPIRDTNV